MSDPVIKGAKRTSSRPAPHSASPKSSAKGRKLTAKAARPKPPRAASEKAPVRKATPAKSSAGAKASANAKLARPAAKQTKRAPQPKPVPGKARAATPARKAAPAKSAKTKSVAAKPQPKKGSAPATKSHPSRSAPATKSIAITAARPAARPAPAPPRQPTRDEAAALKAFERAHKEFTRGHFTDARNLFRTLIEQHTRVSEVTARSRTYLAIAEARLRTESSLPRDPDSLYDRGVIELNRGDFVAAQEMFERALKRDPDASDTHYALAASRARLGAVEAALQALGRAVELKPVLRVRAQTDSDLVSLRNEPDFERIVFGTSRA
ncbi:MAG: tetratricopeptide repeat protein [Acidobacteria bacterium]|nr:tetratricopeptide repeat protein [Acidobacteriota bacterium]